MTAIRLVAVFPLTWVHRDWGQKLGLPGFGPLQSPFLAEQIPLPSPGKTRVFRPARIGASHFMDGIVPEFGPKN